MNYYKLSNTGLSIFHCSNEFSINNLETNNLKENLNIYLTEHLFKFDKNENCLS